MEGWEKGSQFHQLAGLSGAARKRRNSRQDPGAWDGCVLRTQGEVFALASDDKWDKMKSQLGELDEMVSSRSEALVS